MFKKLFKTVTEITSAQTKAQRQKPITEEPIPDCPAPDPIPDEDQRDYVIRRLALQVEVLEESRAKAWRNVMEISTREAELFAELLELKDKLRKELQEIRTSLRLGEWP